MAKRVKGEWVASVPYTHKAFHPYSMAFGEIALAWNELHGGTIRELRTGR
jgi:hypothetical protein